MNTTRIGREIKRARAHRLLTQAQAAQMLGISSTALSYYETGKRIPRDEVKKSIADFCGTTVQALFFAD